jgi:hypothetical protein
VSNTPPSWRAAATPQWRVSGKTAPRVPPSRGVGLASSACNAVVKPFVAKCLKSWLLFPYAHRSLDDARLQSLGVFDANHRRSIMHKVAAVSEADLDSVLTDLTSVIADLEAFTVVSHVSEEVCPRTMLVPA